MLDINQVHNMRAIEGIKKLDKNSVDMIMTSPPYWALRNYGDTSDEKWSDGWKGQLGLEPTPELYVNHLCDIFEYAMVALKKTGTCWVNIGDTYGGNNNGQKDSGKLLIPKSLIGIPFRFALEMIERGWILRNTIIWQKPNAMPSSARDRFTVDFEYIFLFSQNKKYYFEQQRESHTMESIKRAARARNSKKLEQGEYTIDYKTKNKGYKDLQGKLKRGELRAVHPEGRNKRCVWNIPTKGYPEAHFAVYPEELCMIPIKSGCPEIICKKCKKPREKLYEYKKKNKKNNNARGGTRQTDGQAVSFETGLGFQEKWETVRKLKGYTSCKCEAGFQPGIVLDPFMGSGTTGIVAKKLGRDFIGFDNNKEYVKLAMKRLTPYLQQKTLLEIENAI